MSQRLENRQDEQDEQAEQEEDDEQTLVTLTIVNNAAEAQVIQSYLESKGIWAGIPDHNIYSQLPWLGLTAGGFRVEVRRQDFFRASQWMGLVERAGPICECPRCGSDNVHIEAAPTRHRARLLGRPVLAPPHTGTRVCGDCNHQWTVPKPKLIYGAGIVLLVLSIFLVWVVAMFQGLGG